VRAGMYARACTCVRLRVRGPVRAFARVRARGRARAYGRVRTCAGQGLSDIYQRLHGVGL
jgi:hypothetical protein